MLLCVTNDVLQMLCELLCVANDVSQMLCVLLCVAVSCTMCVSLDVHVLTVDSEVPHVV